MYKINWYYEYESVPGWAAIAAASDMCSALIAARKHQQPPPKPKQEPGKQCCPVPIPLLWSVCPWLSDQGS
eukprot:986555-Rhodomonas_salina.1